LLPLEKILNSFIRVKRTINKNVGTVFGSWESPGSLLGVSWESPGSLLGVSWESPGSQTGNILVVYLDVTVSLLGISRESTPLGVSWKPGASWVPGCLLDILINILLSK
jgi:hypothetical protein